MSRITPGDLRHATTCRRDAASGIVTIDWPQSVGAWDDIGGSAKKTSRNKGTSTRSGDLCSMGFQTYCYTATTLIVRVILLGSTNLK